MKTYDEIWQKLTTNNIGFFTSRTASRIPHKPGVYAWFLPLRHHRIERIVNFLEQVRKISAYDSRSGTIGSWDSADHPEARTGFNWDPIRVTVSREIRISESEVIENAWKAITTASTEIQNSFGHALLIGTLFSRPLYVGLTTDLNSRYQQHVKTGSTFKKRFEQHMIETGIRFAVDRLLFACIPIDAGEAAAQALTEERIKALEHVLKVICQPSFSER